MTMQERATACLRALDGLGGRAQSADIWRRTHLDGQGIDPASVRSALHWMARKQDPAVILVNRRTFGRGEAGIWQITDRGRKIIGK